MTKRYKELSGKGDRLIVCGYTEVSHEKGETR